MGPPKFTKKTAIAEGPRDALVSRNSATTKYHYRVALFAKRTACTKIIFTHFCQNCHSSFKLANSKIHSWKELSKTMQMV